MRIRMRPAIVIAVACVTAPALGAPALSASASTAPVVTVRPGAREPTQLVAVHGYRFAAAAPVAVFLGSTRLGAATTGPAGAFTATVTIPKATVSGTHTLVARQQSSGDTAKATLMVRVNWPDKQFNPRNSGYNYLETVIGPASVGSLTSTRSQSVIGVGGLVLDNGLILIASNTLFQALNASTLATVWTTSTSEQIAGIAASNGVIYLNLDNGTLDAYDETTGSFLWEYISGTGHSSGSGPIVSGGVAYVNFNTTVTAVDLSTHQALWTTTLGTLGISLALSGSTLYAVNQTLYALNASTGAITWSTALTPAGEVGGVPAIDGSGTLYIGSDHGVLDAYLPTGTLLWSVKLDDTAAFDPAVAGGIVYTIATSSADRLVALSASDGSVLWTVPLSPITSSPTVANGVVYMSADTTDGNGGLDAFAAASGAALASYPLDGPGSTPAVIANGTIYVGDAGVLAFTPP